MLSKHTSNDLQNICKKTTKQETNALQYSLNDAINIFHEKFNIIEILSIEILLVTKIMISI